MTENRKITTISEYLDSLTPDHRDLVEAFRDVIENEVPEVEEKIMWNSPWYKLHGKEFLWFQNATNHINFGFAFGARLQSNLLEGTGKNMRHIKVKNREDLQKKKPEIRKLIQEAKSLLIN